MADADLKFAEVNWTIHDITQAYPELSEDQAFDILYKMQDKLADAMIWKGWEVIDDMIPKELKDAAKNTDAEQDDDSGVGSEPEPDTALDTDDDGSDEPVHDDSGERCGKNLQPCGLLLHS